jgi:hypothetical protein
MLGQSGLFAGFLASGRNARGLFFHITELTPGALATAALPPTSD